MNDDEFRSLLDRVLDRVGTATSDVVIRYDAYYQSYAVRYERGGKCFKFIVSQAMLDGDDPSAVEALLFDAMLGKD